MVSIGYFLSCEEFGPRELVRQAKMAADAGFERLWISDHYHPWNGTQGRARSCGRSSARFRRPSTSR
jgi:alkanesulfonate monooxygenase SsuD/methylene tetrahydromethanopterin reductase-like flavin-dependent oxidoreductase (luciferase family)